MSESGTPDEDRTQSFKLDDLIAGMEKSMASRRPVLLCLTGRLQGQVFRVSETITDIGRDGQQIRLDDDGVSRHHARIERRAEGLVLYDTGSTNGTLCNTQRVEPDHPAVLREGDRVCLGPRVVFRFEMQDDLDQELRQRLYVLATRDALTGLLNRRAFQERVLSEWHWHQRHKQPCAMLSIDIDFFKRINDTWGHPAGDSVLREFAALVSSGIQGEDLLARTGGEEFVLLARATSHQAACILAERSRSSVEAHRFVWNETTIPVTLSCGVATSDEPGVSTWKDLIALSEARLYEAKKNGRNRIEG